MTATALLIAVGIAIPIFSPVKILLEPASFTLASHVAIFVAMMISPATAVGVTVGTTVGFALGGFPPVIVLRAATHLVFATAGSLYLKRRPGTLSSPVQVHVFSFLIAIIHAVCEVVVVCAFYFSGNLVAFEASGFFRSVILLVGVGTVVHSMIDLEIALVIFKALCKQRGFKAMAGK
jgi:niacin transporter